MSRPTPPTPRWWSVPEDGEITPYHVRSTMDGFLAALNSVSDLLLWMDSEQIDNGTVSWMGDLLHELANQLDCYMSVAFPEQAAPAPDDGDPS